MSSKNESYPLSHERCPECAKQGKDRSSDNLILYSDGHKWCFSCGYYEAAGGVKGFKMNSDAVHQEEITHKVTLPSDSCTNYPERTLDWIRKYDLNKTDLLNNNVLWSDNQQRLIFPVYGDNHLIAYQGRYFGKGNSALTKIPKWLGKGNLKDTFHILGKGHTLVLTEDIVSAIKVSKCGFMSMPLFGCVVGTKRFKRLYSLYKDTVDMKVWLDPDKRAEGVIEAKLGRMCGLHCGVVISDKDPKEHSYDEIRTILKGQV